MSLTGGAHTGTLDFNGQTVTIGTFNYSGTGVRTLTLGAANITLSSGTPWTTSVVTNLTFNAGGSTITCTGNTANFVSAALTFNNIVLTGSSTQVLAAGTSTFANLTRTGAATNSSGFQITGNITVTGTLTITGDNNTTHRLLCSPQGFGSGQGKTLTAAVVSLSNVDFSDMTGAGAAAPFTGTSLGDAGGNSNITTDTPVTRYWVGNGGSWSSTAHWSTSTGGTSGASVPLIHDTVIFDANSITSASQTITQDVVRVNSLDFTNVLNSPIYANSVSSGSQTWMLGNIVFASGMTTSGNASITFRGRSSYSITSNGVSISQNIMVCLLAGQTCTLNDNFVSTNSLGLGQGSGGGSGGGTFDANGKNVTVTSFVSNSSSNATRVLNMGTGTWTINGAGNKWNIANSNFTVNPSTSTIIITDTSSSDKTFTGGANTYNNLSITGSGTGKVIFTDSNTFNTFTFNAPKTVQFTAGTTTTATQFVPMGSSGNVITIQSVTAATHTLSQASGIVNGNFLALTNSIATGGAGFFAGVNSTDSGGNTGWLFNTAPVNIADNLTTTGVVTPLLPSGNASISDNIQVSESITPVIPIKINVFDSVQVAENTAMYGVFSSFPITPILDNFNRADNALTIGTNWSTLDDFFGSLSNQGISSNQVYNPVGGFGNYTAMYWNPSSFGPDAEVFLTIAVRSTTNDTDCPGVYVRANNPGGSFSGYILGAIYSNNTLNITRIDAGSGTQIGASFNQVLSSGDRIGLRIVGSTLSAFYSPNGSNIWELLGTRTDATYTTAGFLGFYMPGNHLDDRLDDFGGGSFFNIAANDNITISENNTLFQNPKDINVSDTIQVAESIIKEAPPLSISNIFDNIAVSENINDDTNDFLINLSVANLLTEAMATTPAGTLSGTATYDSVNQWVQLINNQGNSAGALEYTNALLKTDPFVVNFNWYRSGSADATGFYWGSSATGGTNGYKLYFDFFNNRIVLFFNGSSVTIQSPLSMPNGSFVPVVIRVVYTPSGAQIDASVNGTHVFSYLDTTSRSFGGNLYGWQASNGGQVSVQRITSLIVDDVSQVDSLFVADAVTSQMDNLIAIADSIQVSEYSDDISEGRRNIPIIDNIQIAENIDIIGGNIRKLNLFDSIQVSDFIGNDSIDRVFVAESITIVLKHSVNIADAIQVSEFIGYPGYDSVLISEFTQGVLIGPVLFASVVDNITVEAQIIYHNLVANPSFELDTNNWDLDGDFSLTSTDSFSGTHSVKQISNGGFENFGTHNDTNQGIVVLPNTNYTLSFYYKMPSVSGFPPIIQVNAGSEFGSNLHGQQLGTPSVWTRYTATFNTNNNTKIYIRIQNNNGTVTAFYDAFQIEIGSVANPYIDGSLPGNNWDGTPHESTSTTAQNSVTAKASPIALVTSDIIQIAESTTPFMSGGRANVIDNIHVTESVNDVEFNIEATIIDNVRISETILGTAKLLIPSVVDQITIAESVNDVEFNVDVNLSDNVTLSENIASFIPAGNAIVTEAIIISETTTQRIPTASATIIDNILVFESINNFANIIIPSVVDNITVAESINDQEGNFDISVVDSITISENIATLSPSNSASVIDLVQITEAVNELENTFNITITNSENMTITESVTASANLVIPAIHDQITIAETINDIEGNLDISVSDTIHLSENIAFLGLPENEVITDTIAVSESLTVHKSVQTMFVTDSIKVSDIAVNNTGKIEYNYIHPNRGISYMSFRDLRDV